MRTIHSDDFKVGMLITAMRGEKYQSESGGFMGVGSTVITREDRSYQYAIYRVLVVDLPMIVMEEVVSTGGHIPTKSAYSSTTRAADTRRYTFAEVSREFVLALNDKALPAAGEGTT